MGSSTTARPTSIRCGCRGGSAATPPIEGAASAPAARRCHQPPPMAPPAPSENHPLAGVALASRTGASGWRSLGPVLAAADELASVGDTDQMLRRAVEMARERIGLERVGL